MSMLMNFVYHGMLTAVFIAAVYSSGIAYDNRKKHEVLENVLWGVAFVLLVCCIAIETDGL